MRGIYYIATVILCYRRVIDKILHNTLTDEDKNYYLKVLNRVANRDSAPQFYDHLPDENDQYYDLRNEESNQDFLGIIKEYDAEKKLAIIEERNYFKVGDEVEIIGPNHETYKSKITAIYDEDDKTIDVANKPRMIIKVPFNLALEKNDIMRVKLNI